MNSRHQSGFTLVELVLAMSFVSLLLMAITMTIIQVTNIYTKGLTMRAVTQVGQSIAGDMRRSIEASRPIDVGKDGAGGLNFKPMVAIGGALSHPDGGRLCTGLYSYIWNNGQALADPVNHYADTKQQIRLIKTVDNGGTYCANPAKNINHEAATELLGGDGYELALQSFSIKQVIENPDASDALYLIRLEIGTNDQAALDRPATPLLDISCRPPSTSSGLDDYCAVNKFEFTARAANAGGVR